MIDPITPDFMWYRRADKLAMDYARLEKLRDDTIQKLKPDLITGYNFLLHDIQLGLDHLYENKHDKRWQRLSDLQKTSKQKIGLILELLAGIALDSKEISAQGINLRYDQWAEKWLNSLRANLGLNDPLVIIPSSSESMITLKPSDPITENMIRVPFLEHDLWSLPLLGQAIGILASQDDPKHTLKPRLKELAESGNLLPLLPQIIDKPDLLQTHLCYLYADIYATLVLGPAYALSAFMLELNFASPMACALVKPDEAESDRDTPAMLPSPIQRSMMIINTLEEVAKKSDPHNAYSKVIEQLNNLWDEAVIDGKKNREETAKEWRQYHRMLYGIAEASIPYPVNPIKWEIAQKYLSALKYWNKKNEIKDPVDQNRLYASEQHLTELLWALWSYRLEYPDKADKAQENARLILEGKDWCPNTGNVSRSIQYIAFETRLGRYKQRWQNLEKLLKSNLFRDLQTLKGRFYQLISQQYYFIDKCMKKGVSSEGWKMLSEIQPSARILMKESMGFVSGWFIKHLELDRELEGQTYKRCEDQKQLTLTEERKGPSICTLADKMLSYLVQRTGVNWNSRTVVGLNTSLTDDTDVIQVSFLDWSIDNLLILAHEFGHVVARTIPEFQEFRHKKAWDATQKFVTEEDRKKNYSLISKQIEELFCDLFALYVAGPAYACHMILQFFNPYEAYLPRGAHPTHDQRVKCILYALGLLYKSEKKSCNGLRVCLWKAWDSSVKERGAENGANKYKILYELKTVMKWGKDLFTIIDQLFQFAGFSQSRWRYAVDKSEYLRLINPTLSGLLDRNSHDYVQGIPDETFPLIDVLNAFWYRRLGCSSDARVSHRLLQDSYKLGSEL